MATMRDATVNLVLRARDDASRVVENAAATLNNLFDTQQAGGASAATFAKAMATAARAVQEVDAAAGRGAAAVERVQERLAGRRAELAALNQEAADAQRALSVLNGPDAIVNAGRDQTARLAQVRELGARYEQLQRQIERATGAIAADEATVTRSRSSLQGLGSAAIAASEAYARTSAEAAKRAAVAERLAAALRQEADAAKRAADVQRVVEERFSPRLQRGPATANGAGFEALAAEFDRQEQRDAAAVATLRNELDPAAAAQRRFNAALKEAQDLHARGKITTDELTQRTHQLTEESKRAVQALHPAGRRAAGLFGLRPHELTNLTYQVNDVATQLASGASVGQAVAQQAGQVLQLFPRITAAIIGAFGNPAVLGFAAVLGGVALGMKEVADQAERLRRFDGLLSLNAAGGTYDAAQLAEGVKGLQRYGVAASDAEKAFAGFVSRGVAPERFAELGRTARDMADVLGGDVPDAADKLAAAFTGGFEAVTELDKATNAYTAAERDRIRQLFDSGRAEDARALALQLFSERMDEAARKSRGPWAQAFRELGSAWQSLLDTIADTGLINRAAAQIDGIAKKLRDAAADFRDLQNGDFGAIVARNFGGAQQPAAAPDANARIRELEADAAKFDRAAKAATGRLAGTFAALAARSREQLARALAERDRARPVTVNSPDTPEAKREREALRALSLQEQLERARDRMDAKEAGRLAGLIAARGVVGDTLKAETARIAAAREEEQVRERIRQKAERDRKEAERLAKQTRFIAPVDGRVSSGFGPRRSPGGVGSTFHRGVDYAVPVGTPVKAPAAGVVVETGYDAKLGKFVLIDHGNRVQTRFGHLSDNSIAEGAVIRQGQVVGRSGNTGSATTGPHLHQTVTVAGKPVDPLRGVFATDGPARFEVNQAEALADYEEDREKRAAKRLEQQRRLTDAVSDEIAERGRAVDVLAATDRLQGEALIMAERAAAVAQAEADIRQRVLEVNRDLAAGEAPLTVTDADVQRVRDLAEAEFDLTRARDVARARTDDVERPVEELADLRDALRDRRDALRELGDNAGADAVAEQLDGVNARLREAIGNLIRFYAELNPETDQLGRTREAIDATIAGLRTARDDAREWGAVMGVSTQEIAQAFASDLTGSIARFAQAIGNGADAFKSLRDAFLNFASSFLLQVAQMIQQQIALNVVAAIGRALGVSMGGGAGAAIGGGGASLNGAGGAFTSVGVFHSGGTIGGPAPTRRAEPAWWAGAARFHTGGIIGLAPDEIPIIAQRGEEMLSRSDPRNRLNGGGAADGGNGDTTVVVVDNRADAVEQALRRPMGERVLLRFLQDNAEAVRAAIGQ